MFVPLLILAVAQPVSPRAVLDAYRAAQPPLPAWRMSAEASATSRVQTKQAANDTAHRKSLTIFGRGDARDVRFDTVKLDDAGRPTATTTMRRLISRDAQGRGFSWETRDGGPPGNGIYSSQPTDPWFTNSELQMWGGEAFVGKIGRDVRGFADVLNDDPNLRLRPDREDVDGHSCYVLESQTDAHGKYTVWLDPDAGYQPRRALVEKTAANEFSNTTLTKAGWAAARWELNGVTIEKRGDRFVPTQFTVVEKYDSPQGFSSSGTTGFRVTAFETNPDFDALGAFKVDVPEGTLFRLVNVPQIAYAWDGKGVQPAVDHDVLEGLNAAVAQAVPAAQTRPTGRDPAANPQGPPLAAAPADTSPALKAAAWGVGGGAAIFAAAVAIAVVLRRRRKPVSPAA